MSWMDIPPRACQRAILETAFVPRNERGRLSPASLQFEKMRDTFRQSGIGISGCFSKTETGWASCSTHRSLRRFSANSRLLPTRFGTHQRPHVLHAQGHEEPLEKFRRRSLSNSQSPPGFSGRDAFAPYKLCFRFFKRLSNFPILARRELGGRQEGFGGIPDHCQLLGICFPQMLENFKCAHGVNLPCAPSGRNRFPGVSEQYPLAIYWPAKAGGRFQSGQKCPWPLQKIEQ